MSNVAPKLARRSQRGITLIETTVMLSVLFILGGALSPVVSDSISRAREVRAQSDLNQIAIGLVNFQRDVGAWIVSDLTPNVRGRNGLGLAELLVTDGDVPKAAHEGDPAADAVVPFLRRPVPKLGNPRGRQWIDLPAERLDSHLRDNRKGYPLALAGPGSGWNGPYLTKPIEGDSWGNRYMVNIGHLRPGAPHEQRCAVFVISAGPNGVIETPFEQPVADAAVVGDDLAVRIQ